MPVTELRPSQLETLRHLPTTASVLASDLKVDRGSARSRLVRLEAKGYVQRLTADFPWNPWVYLPTHKGKEALQAAEGKEL
jgi:DNA-binding MarR family transcriptional regulator